MVEDEDMQQGGVKIVRLDRILANSQAELVRGTDRGSAARSSSTRCGPTGGASGNAGPS